MRKDIVQKNGEIMINRELWVRDLIHREIYRITDEELITTYTIPSLDNSFNFDLKLRLIQRISHVVDHNMGEGARGGGQGDTTRQIYDHVEEQL